MTGIFDGIAEPEQWMQRGRCRETDPEVFFPEKGGSCAPAKAICRRCEVSTECLQYALDRGERHGVWGGLSELERRELRREERSAA